ncbi:hypothetical protein [Neisseria meningitidis]|uniref:hypothetical protein n=1 Tax=Neisseria meningitidis TaxID=487 RepID=UPI000317CE66|nr:hypothetical protein [Neisseria meningitidis]MBJ1825446.1 hypothetical protein [Neisseria meningitidis]MCV6651688.1 hypothetical protein [Neisseria meningitidis]MCV6654595.1 hypothetical protein [Neisseria meningitidis]MCV6661130.1 hypothetical protein [Neisseria meningitidis]MCV6672965.1 hypothetical protein [Neisseria meningitidis]
MPSERSFCIGARDIRNAGRIFATAGQAVCFAGIGEGKSEMRTGFYFDAAAFRRCMETPKTTKTGFRRHFWQSRLKTCRIWVTR